jgi:hypothetical protein
MLKSLMLEYCLPKVAGLKKLGIDFVISDERFDPLILFVFLGKCFGVDFVLQNILLSTVFDFLHFFEQSVLG